MASACRTCGIGLNQPPILRYPGMPQSAQYFPTVETVAQDRPLELRIMQCQACGLMQLDNEPVDYFREVIRASAFSAAMAEFRARQFGEFVARFQLQGRKIVEIGCGRGEYLALLKRQGVEAYGLEAGAAAVAHCLRDNLSVQQGYIERTDQRLDNAPFAAFFMFNFLEHMPAPRTVLQGIAANLSDDAVGLVEVPNFNMMLRERQFTEFVTDHLCYFTRETLTLLLGLSGFEVLACEEIWDDYILSATVRKRPVAAIAGFAAAQSELKAALHRFADSCPGGKIAVWGAGHQALAVIALTGLADKICAVVDSAPFKQHKLTPGSHLPIIPPDAFYANPATGLIVMAAAYCDEVVALVKQHLKQPLPIAVLRPSGLECLT